MRLSAQNQCELPEIMHIFMHIFFIMKNAVDVRHFTVIKFSLIILSLIIIGNVNAQTPKINTVTTGPKNGTLVIVGGGSGIDSILKEFVNLAGGADAPIVFIPTADGAQSYTDSSGVAGTLRKLGAKNVTVLHTYDKIVANSESFVKPLELARAVWFGGGRQWRLVDAYKNTMTEKMLWKILEKGGVIGGTSAGATIQGSFLTRGDTRNNLIVMGDHQEGFGFIKNIAIDQHILVRNRQFDMFEILKSHPALLGIGIDEGTAIIVKGNQFEVTGRSYVAIYDGTFWSREGNISNNISNQNTFYFLKQGDKYDMLNRKVINKN